jgi:hypothetical protein
MLSIHTHVYIPPQLHPSQGLVITKCEIIDSGAVGMRDPARI